MKVKEESEKVGFKLNIQKTKIMASGPITSWQIEGETVETVTGFILGGSKITTDGDCSHEIKRHLLLGRIVITNLDSILKTRDITLPTKVCLVKTMVFPVFRYGCESWTVKTIALTRWNFVGKVISLLFNVLSWLITAFLPKSKPVLISWLQSPSAVILELLQK